MNTIDIQYFDAPCGRLILGNYEGQLCLCGWMNDLHRERIDERIQRMLNARFVVHPSQIISRTMSELEEYFNGERKLFDIPLLMLGTNFQKMVPIP